MVVAHPLTVVADMEEAMEAATATLLAQAASRLGGKPRKASLTARR